MGKPSSSCFKIIGCGGGDAVEEEEDDLTQDEVKASSDKRRWSFRKRSSRHQVLSTTVISEPISICSSKQSQEFPNSLHSSKHSLIEKPKIQAKPVETSPLPSDIVNKESPPPLPEKSATPVGPVLNEPDAIIIQAAIRGYLAREEHYKLKSVVKLQAVIRGHLVRRQAIGTLQCIQAIIRMQTLVRARRARRLQGKEDSLKRSNKTSTKKLLSNGLARQLLETSPTTKAIRIKCEPSKSDSTWKWLERWMAAASGESHELERNFDDSSELEGDNKIADTGPANDNQCSIPSVLSDSELASAELILSEKINEFEFASVTAPHNNSTSLPNDDVDNLKVNDVPLNISTEEHKGTEIVNVESLESISDNKASLPNPCSVAADGAVSVSVKCDYADDTSNHSTEIASSYETLENDENKSVIAEMASSYETLDNDENKSAIAERTSSYVTLERDATKSVIAERAPSYETLESDEKKSVIAERASSYETLEGDEKKSVNAERKSLYETVERDEKKSVIAERESSYKTLESDEKKSVIAERESSYEGLESDEKKSVIAEGPSSYETLESDEKKSVIGSRKLCNPAFIAAQSKFEELSSSSTVGRSTSPAKQNVALKSKTESNNIQVESLANSNEAISADSSMFHNSRAQAAVSECGTEISISSTLDSPDRSEMEGGEIVLEIEAMEKQKYSTNTDAVKSLELDGSMNDSTLQSDIKEPQRPDGGEQSTANSDAPNNLGDQNPLEPTTSDVQSRLEGTTEQTRSPAGTPRSYAKEPEPHGTPSSDISVSSKKSKKDSSMPRQKSNLVGKRSPSTPSNDWGGRSSTDNLSKDSKTSKRRNSFVAAKADHADQEPRLSSSTSLPGYMQATISARAKAHANASQQSSPDLLDNQPKKRHSLPMENGKQSSSPRMERSASQAQQSAKINGGVHSPHNSAERRWQR